MKTTRVNSVIIYSLLFCSVFFAGYVFGKILNVPYFSLEREVNPVSVLSICVSIIIAFIVTRVLTKRSEQKRTETNIVLSQVSRICGFVDDLHCSLSDSSLGYSQAAALCKQIRVTHESVCSILDHLGISYKGTELSNSIHYLKSLLTTTPHDLFNDDQAHRNSYLHVENGILVVPPLLMLDIDRVVNTLRTKLFDLQVLVNRR